MNEFNSFFFIILPEYRMFFYRQWWRSTFANIYEDKIVNGIFCYWIMLVMFWCWCDESKWVDKWIAKRRKLVGTKLHSNFFFWHCHLIFKKFLFFLPNQVDYQFGMIFNGWIFFSSVFIILHIVRTFLH